MSVSEGLKERREDVDDEGLVAVIDEVLENQGSVAREVREPTLMHGSDTVNYGGIIDVGLVPGFENSAETGESGQSDEVAFSTSFPVALRYGELTEAAEYSPERNGTSEMPDSYGSVQSPMVVEVPVDQVEQVSVDSSNESVISSVLGADLNSLQTSVVLDCIQNGHEESFPFDYDEGGVVDRIAEGDSEAEQVFYALSGEGYGSVQALEENHVFEEISYDEVNADFLQEVNAPHSPVDEEAVIYVPRGELDRYREEASEHGFEGDVHSIEARAMVHEERMKDVYRRQGTVNFVHPADEGEAVNIVHTAGKTSYDRSEEVVDISRLRGEPVYDRESLI